MLRGGGVADARQKIGNWIGLHNSPGRLLCPFTNWLSLRRGFLPWAPCRGSRYGTFETCECRRARGRRCGNDCGAESRTSACACLFRFLRCVPLVTRLFRSAQRYAQTFQKFAAFFVVLRGGGKGDVHALDLVHARVVNFRKHELVLEA